MEEKHKKAEPGVLDISIRKGENDEAYTGGMSFGNTEVLIEALAVLTQRAADMIGVSPLVVNIKVAELIVPPENGSQEE